MGKRDNEYVGVTVQCCRVYTGNHRNRDGNVFVGWCPKCAAKMEVGISRNGTNYRIFGAG